MRLLHQAGSKLSSALLISATLSRERISSGTRVSPKIVRTRARATAAVMIKRIQSRLRKCGDRDREDGASFYGALNSDEVARSILGDPNYPGTDKQTADGSRGGENNGDVQKQDSDF